MFVYFGLGKHVDRVDRVSRSKYSQFKFSNFEFQVVIYRKT